MSISRKVKTSFIMPDKHMTMTPSWREASDVELFNISADGVVTASDKLTAMPYGETIDLIIPSAINGIKVTGIGNNAFEMCYSVNSVEIPDGVVSIGYSMAGMMTSSIIIPRSVKSIHVDAFRYSSLTSIIIKGAKDSITGAPWGAVNASITWFDESLVFVDENGTVSATDYLKTLTSDTPIDLVIPSAIYGITIKTIGNNGFANCRALRKIDIPESVISIDAGSFNNCSSLESIIINKLEGSISGAPWGAVNAEVYWNHPYLDINSQGSVSGNTVLRNMSADTPVDLIVPSEIKGTTVTNIGNMGSRALRSVVVPEGVTKLSGRSFQNCFNLISIKLPETLTSIGDESFYNCQALASISIPNSVTEIGGSAFWDCRSLTSIDVPDGVTYLSMSLFTLCTSLETVNLPKNVTGVNAGIFYKCSSLKTVSLPKGIKNISTNMFSYCSSLNKIDILDTVTSIDTSAFNSCTSLTSITIPSSVTSIDTSAFRSCNALASINIKKPQDSITGAPWGATNAIINWLG